MKQGSTYTVNLPSGPRYEKIGYFDVEKGEFVTLKEKRASIQIYFPEAMSFCDCGDWLDTRFHSSDLCSWFMWAGDNADHKAEVWL